METILLGIMGTLVSALIYVVKTTMSRSDRLLKQRDDMLSESIKVLKRSVELGERRADELVTHLELIHKTQEKILEKVSA
jgi:hypothetical protein